MLDRTLTTLRTHAVPALALAVALTPTIRVRPAVAQIVDVPPLCDDRAPVTGVSPFDLDAPRPERSGSRSGRAASDLFCIDLLPTGRGGDATGVVSLTSPPTPFGAAVDADGYTKHALTAWLARLPDPSTLGPYTTYVAWAAPITLDEQIKLGVVREGRNDLGQVALAKYLVMVTAEASDSVGDRTGPLVLRGRSPSSRMEAHDLLARAPSAEEGGTDASHRHADSWAMPPMYAGVPMLPGVMQSRPRVAPLRPAVDPSELPVAAPRSVVALPDGGTLDLTAGFVKREIDGRELVMLGFNGQVPGPLVAVRERSTIFVDFTNESPLPTAVHWHGIRLDNRYDGVPGVTQDPVEPGGRFRYTVHFPDAGIYWYHPHHREDVQQEMGLAGNLLVEPLDESFWNPVHREEVVMLDDILLGDSDLVPFGGESANYMLMGRFGNVLLTNGEPEYGLDVVAGEVVRFFLTNASNTRTFNLSLRPTDEPAGPPLPIKVVGSDIGRLERETMVESVVIAPAERYVVEIRFPQAGAWALTNRVQGINHRQGVFLEESSVLGTIAVSGAAGVEDSTPDSGRTSAAGPDPADAFATLRTNADVVADIDRYREHFERAPDQELLLTLEVDDLPMAIEQSMNMDWVYFNPVEWTGTMPVMNWATTGAEIRWILRDLRSGADNESIDWSFRVGDVVKIRVTNDRGAFHAMQHPLHIHGQRFLVLGQNGVPNDNLAWKDTVLLPAGSTTDILLELSNPGRWMVHCHIAEHLESGMKFVFDVEGD